MNTEQVGYRCRGFRENNVIRETFIGVQCPNYTLALTLASVTQGGGVGRWGWVATLPTSRFPIPIPGAPGRTGGDCHLWAREAGVDSRE